MSPSIWSACQVQLSSIGGAKSWTRKSLLTIWDLQYLNFVYVRAYFCIFGTTFLYPKHLKHILHHLQRTKKLDPQAHPLGRDPKCRKGKIVFPVELSKVLLIYRLHWRVAYNCESYKYRISEVKDLDNLRFSLAECTTQFHSWNAWYILEKESKIRKILSRSSPKAIFIRQRSSPRC